jgi:hypothetical protein
LVVATTADTEKKKLGKEEAAYKERAKRARQVAAARSRVSNRRGPVSKKVIRIAAGRG